MPKSVIIYGIIFAIMMAIDFIWLGFIAQKLYRNYIGFLLNDSFKLLPGILFYLLYAVGILVFVVQPMLKDGNITQAFIRGAFFGLVCYATYDLTNLATVKNWPVVLTLIDLTWGTALTGIVSALAVWATKVLKLA